MKCLERAAGNLSHRGSRRKFLHLMPAVSPHLGGLRVRSDALEHKRLKKSAGDGSSILRSKNREVANRLD
jgi:hypothetical protein